MKLNLLLFCLFAGLTPILGAPEMEKKAATNSLDTSPATKGNGDVLANGTIIFFSPIFLSASVSIWAGILQI
ncbi:hypothetical protein EMPG_13674 [Blastomyces silverae]|uniref:Uncharacterized protein n=1 Tax=Blastomyces silverae TaxID=2060906 RepID=A0A0H1BPD5_9EURO|nr:hypothetical protein EMPG_13674 [Blastomyces silverae]